MLYIFSFLSHFFGLTGLATGLSASGLIGSGLSDII